MISDIERNYQPKNWEPIEATLENTRAMRQHELYYFCNSSSPRFADLLRQQKAEKAVLLDYELLSLDMDPLNGLALSMSGDRIVLTVFTAEGSKSFIEKEN